MHVCVVQLQDMLMQDILAGYHLVYIVVVHVVPKVNTKLEIELHL